MSYSISRSLGALPVPTGVAALPAWDQAAYLKQFEHEQSWGRIGDETVLQGILATMRLLGATDTTTARVNGELREEGPFMQGLKALWVRFGRNKAQWPGARGEFNFGPNTNDSKDLRIHEDFYKLIQSPTGMWRVSDEDGYVRVARWDKLYSDVIRQKLIQGGYLDRTQEASVKDDSAMGRALKQWWIDAKAQGTNVGEWPEGINFGPNTNGDEIRISDAMLTNLLTGESPRAIAAKKELSDAIKNMGDAMKGKMTLRPPVIGTILTAPKAKYGAQLRLQGKLALPSQSTLSIFRTALKK